jgi:arylsulfatase A-like enzyme
MPIHYLATMRHVTFIFLFLFSGLSYSQTYSPADRPKLVVGIVVDQMKQEYLYRYYSKFGNDGFKRLMNDGFMLKNAHYNYAPTYTGPGHASVYTGTTPSIHGVIGNDFYDKETKRMVNCVEDGAQTAVGHPSPNGKVSPSRMLTTTITDELKLFTNKQAKVIGLSIKDRGAVLPAGHMADAAYWYDRSSGKFITSTYYMNALPSWVQQFNNKNLSEIYLSQEWKPLLPLEQYTESTADQSPYERKLFGKDKAMFPYNLPAMRKVGGDFDLLTYTPFANDLLTEFAKTAITAERMGKDAITDFLALSYSTTDILGHATGPRSVEVQDMYIRLDRNIADLLKKLDQEVGQNNYVVFLTADHAVADIPQYLKDNRVPAGYFSGNRAAAMLNEFLEGYFPGRDLVANVSNEQVFLNHEAFQGTPKSSGLDFFIVAELIGKYLMTHDGVANYYTEGVIRQGRYDEEGLKGMFVRGFHPKRSGDVVVVLEPGWFETNYPQGTTHGSPYPYDTHVPVLFYGKGVKKGSSTRYHPITCISPTLVMLLNITFPNGSTGKPVSEMFE